MFSGRWRCTRELLEAAPRLRGIANPTIGVETVDLGACAELGIAVGHGSVEEGHHLLG